MFNSCFSVCSVFIYVRKIRVNSSVSSFTLHFSYVDWIKRKSMLKTGFPSLKLPWLKLLIIRMWMCALCARSVTKISRINRIGRDTTIHMLKISHSNAPTVKNLTPIYMSLVGMKSETMETKNTEVVIPQIFQADIVFVKK